MGTMDRHEPNGLRRCREGHGLTQAMIGRLLGLKDGSWVSRWEHGEAVPNLESAIKLSILLDIPVSDLFGGLTERARSVLHEQAVVVSSMSEVSGLPEATEQPEEVP